MTTDQAQREIAERLTSYVKHQVSKGPDGIRDTVQKGHDQLMGLLEGLSDEQASFKPSAEEWSVFQVLDHVLSAKHATVRLCATLARGEASDGFGEGDGEKVRPLTALRERLDAAHGEQPDFVAALSPETNVETRYDHFLFGAFNCQEWAAFQRIHDGDHAGQIEQIKSAQGFPA